MARYKRNQVEEAIASILEGSGKPSSDLRTRLKRLLDTDRERGRNPRSADPGSANFAFYSGEPPGRGTEVWFSDYEAFALLTGLILLQHGWPQSFPVRILRRLRRELEAQYARILRQDPSMLFNEEAIRRSAEPGSLVVSNTDPVFLVIANQKPSKRGRSEAATCGICRGMEEVSKFLKREKAQLWSVLELVENAHALLSQLSRAKPRKRGRGN